MNEKFPEYKGLDLSEVNKEILKTIENILCNFDI